MPTYLNYVAVDVIRGYDAGKLVVRGYSSHLIGDKMFKFLAAT